jgi:GntR family transcriptional regulator
MIDHEGDIPVYVQLADILREQIRQGELAPRRPLPSIRTMMQRYEVSDGTVKKAVQVLRDEGLVRTVPGRGVYVVARLRRGDRYRGPVWAVIRICPLAVTKMGR